MTERSVATVEPQPLDLALLKAVGLDRAAPEQRELAINIAQRYGLDLLLKHLVLIDGRPYVTRDALLHIAHRSGAFDGIETTIPEIVGDEWRCTATVWRKDMSHPFTYPGRYPVKGGNTRFAPEMAIKVAESMALRRAFNVAAPVVEERWDVELPAEPPPPKVTLAERAAAKAAEVTITALAPEITATIGPVEPSPNVSEVTPPADFGEQVVGLTVEQFQDAARHGGLLRGSVMAAIGCKPTELDGRIAAMTDEDRGELATALGLEWRS